VNEHPTETNPGDRQLNASVEASPVTPAGKAGFLKFIAGIALLQGVVLAGMTVAAFLTMGTHGLVDWIFGIGILVLAAIRMRGGLGLLRFRPYSRRLELLLTGLLFVAALLGTFSGIVKGDPGQTVIMAVLATYAGAALYYLTRPAIRDRFGPQRAAPLRLSPVWYIAPPLLILVATAFFLVQLKPRASYQKRTMADLRTLATAVEAFATDYNRYPEANSMEELGRLVSPTYVRTLPAKDGWRTEFRYLAWKQDPKDEAPQNYRLASAGKDRRFEYADLRRYTKRETHHFDCDIVFGQGEFIQYPEGVQDGSSGVPVISTSTITETTPPAEAAAAYLKSGDDAFAWGSYQRALEMYQSAIERDPSNAQAHIGAGRSQLGLGRAEEASLLLARAAELNPKDASPWLHLADFFSEKGDTPASLEAISRARAVAPADLGVLRTAIMVYRRAGRHNEAMDTITQARKLGLGEDEATYQLGLIHVARGDYAAARGQHQKLDKINPRLAQSLLEAIQR
jgi:Flp pilus assembly protein TadD